MTIYVVYLLLITGENAIIQNAKFRDSKKVFCIIAFIELLLIYSLRSVSIGADTGNYVGVLEYFERAEGLEVFTMKPHWSTNFEEGYMLLTRVCAFLRMDSSFFLFIISLLTLAPLFLFIYRYSSSPILSVLTYFAFGLFSRSLGIFRQFIAMGIVMCSIHNIWEKKLVRYILSVLLAFTFHRTAIVYLILYWLYNYEFKKTDAFKIYIGVVLSFGLSQAALYIISIVFPRYIHFTASIYNSGEQTYLRLLIFLLMVSYTFFVSNYYLERNPIIKVSICALVIATLLQPIAYSISVMGRMLLNLMLFLIILIPEFIEEYNERSKRIARIIVIILLIILSYLDISGNQYITPYKFMWETHF